MIKKHFLKVLSFICIIILIPAVIIFSLQFADRAVYLTSLVIIVLAMIPFFVSFESRKPQAREIVIIAVLCALSIVSRIIFIWFPDFKPMTAVIIITGIAFGAETGFLTGAVSALVSNFIFGQGLWTPWQMFAFGLAGFLSGILYKAGLVKRSTLPLCIFGAVLTMVIVGPLLDTCSLFTGIADITFESAAAIYVAGLIPNLIHSSATVLTLLIASKPIFSELDRLKIKYGLLK